MSPCIASHCTGPTVRAVPEEPLRSAAMLGTGPNGALAGRARGGHQLQLSTQRACAIATTVRSSGFPDAVGSRLTAAGCLSIARASSALVIPCCSRSASS